MTFGPHRLFLGTLLAVTLMPLGAQNPGPDTLPLLAIHPIDGRGGTDPGTATLLTDMIVSACAAIPEIDIIEPDAFRGDAPDYQLEATVWPEFRDGAPRYRLIITLHDMHRRSTVDSTLLTISPGNAPAAIDAWRDDLEIVLRRRSDERLAGQARYLLTEGSIDLAWEYLLAAMRLGVPVDPGVEAEIRTARAAAERDALARGRRLPPEAGERLTTVLVVAPGAADVEPLLERLAEQRTAILERRLEELEESVRSAVSQGNFTGATGQIPTDGALREYAPERLSALSAEVTVARRDALERAAASRLRRQDPGGARGYLAQAAALEIPPEPQTLTAWEDALRTRRERTVRRENTPDPLGPRATGDRLVWAALGGIGTGDPEQRYGNQTVELTAELGYSHQRPLVPYLRLHRGVQLGVVRQPRTTRADARITIAPAVGTNRAELALGATVGAALLSGTPGVLQGGATAGITATLTTRISGGLTAGLNLTGLTTVWIPELYLTPATVFSVRIGWTL